MRRRRLRWRGPAPFITFYSFKGGVGRSMALINVASIVAARGFRVLVIDMDLEAPGLSFLANPRGSQAQSNGPSVSQPGIVECLLDAVELGAQSDLFGKAPPEALDGYYHKYELPPPTGSKGKEQGHVGAQAQDSGALFIMPAGTLDAEYSNRLERLDLASLYREGLGLALIEGFKKVVRDSNLFDFVFVDSRTGFSDESGICTRDLADHLVVVSGLNRQNVQGTSQFLAALKAAEGTPPEVQIVLSPIPNGEDALVDEREEAAQTCFREAWGKELSTKLHIPYHPQLALTEEPHIFRRRHGYLFDAYTAIEEELLERLGETSEVWAMRAFEAYESRQGAAMERMLCRARNLARPRFWGDQVAAGLLRQKKIIASELTERLIEISGPAMQEPLQIGLADKFDDESRRGRHQGVDEVGRFLKLALSLRPASTRHLGNYGNFFYDQRRDLGRAQELYVRAIDAEPDHPSNLGNYATFLCDERGELDRAEEFYERALEADFTTRDNFGNYGRFKVLHQDREHGLELIHKALESDDPCGHRLAIDLECWTYLYLIGPEPERADALRNIRDLVLNDKLRTGKWDFSGIIEMAKNEGHPEAQWLEPLAEVLGGRSSVDTLDGWPAWAKAKAQE